MGILLASERVAQGLTVSSLAKRAGISSGYLSQVETGKRNPSPPVIRRLSGALDVNPNRIFHAVGLITMPLVESLSTVSGSQPQPDDINAEEREQLLLYLDFLRFRKTMPTQALATGK